MNIKVLLAILVTGVMVAAVGCGGGEKTYSVDPAVVSENFQNVPSNVQGNVDDAVRFLKQEDFENAAKSLTKVASALDLSKEQKDALLEVMKQMQNVMATEPEKSTKEAHMAIRKFAGAIDPDLASDGSYGRQKPPQQ